MFIVTVYSLEKAYFMVIWLNRTQNEFVFKEAVMLGLLGSKDMSHHLLKPW